MKYQERESSTLEFKQKIPAGDQIVKTAIGFSNLFGGQIIIGIDDDRNIKGINEDEVDELREILYSSIYDACMPVVIPRIHPRRLGEKVVLIIEIAEGLAKPYFKKSKGMKEGTYIRIGNLTQKASPEIIRELQWQGEGRYLDETPAYSASPGDLDQHLILDFLQNRKNKFKGSIDNKLLKSYGLLVDTQTRSMPSVGGILLFGKDPQKYITESFIICTHFKGVSGRDAIATVDCTGNLFQQIDEALQFIFSRLYKSFVIRGIRRDESLEIPESAVREIVINAVAHRNYSIQGPAKIAIYENRLEIFSPGPFPGPLDVSNLEQGMTYLRNKVITRVFREAGIVEKLGSGFITLFSSYRDYGLEKPTVLEGGNFVKCTLPRKKAYTDPVMNIDTNDVREPGIIQGNLSSLEGGEKADLNLVLSLFEQTDRITMSLILKRTGWARATAGRRLKKLMDAGRILKIGSGRYCHYLKARL